MSRVTVSPPTLHWPASDAKRSAEERREMQATPPSFIAATNSLTLSKDFARGPTDPPPPHAESTMAARPTATTRGAPADSRRSARPPAGTDFSSDTAHMQPHGV